MKFLILFISIFTYFLSIFAEEKPVTTSKGLYLKTKQEIQEWKNSARYALVIGVNDYLNMNRLKFAAGDAKKMYLSLKQVGEFQEVVLMNDFQEKDSLKPYYNNIMKQYKRLIDKNPSLLLIYFSGHGFMNVKGENVVATLNSDVKQNKEVLNLTSLIKQAKDKGIGQVVFFVDACREQLEEGKKNVRKSQSFSKIREEAVNAKGWAIMVGTSPGDYSYEDNELNSGIFSHFLVEGLNGGFQKEGGLYEYLTFQDLKNYVDKKMRKYIKKSNREKQKPYIVGDFTGDFLISTRVPENSIRYEKYLIGQDRDNKYIRILYDTKQRKIEEAFFTITDAREYIKADVNGIARISFDYGKSYFKASQYNLKGEFIFEHGLSIEKNKIILKYSGGQKFYKEVYDKNLLLLNKTEYKDKADKIGTTIFIKRTGSLLYSMEESFYKDEKYTQKIVNEEGIFKIKYKFLNGNLIEKSYYDDSENFKKDKWGIAKYEYKYKEKYRILEAYYNEKNKLTPGQEGIAKYTFTYQEDKLLETRLYNEEDKLLQDEERIAIIKNTYRDKNLIDTRYFNGDGKPLENSYGYARIRYKYDSKSKRIEEKFYNRNDELIKEGIAFKRTATVLPEKNSVKPILIIRINFIPIDFSESQSIRIYTMKKEEKLKKNTTEEMELS